MSHQDICEQHRCEEEAKFRMYWPGRTPINVCYPHLRQAENIARSLGFPLPWSQLEGGDDDAA